MPQTAKVIRMPRKAQRTEAREVKMARIILLAIQHELRDVEFFTREDLLQLRPLQSVATITRYREICDAVHRLIYARQIYQITRTELCLAGKTNAAKTNSGAALFDNYMNTVRRLVSHHEADLAGKPFDVMTLVERWTQDQHLTRNAKRVAVRVCLKRLLKERAIVHAGDATLAYVVPKSNVTPLVNGAK